MKFPNAEKVFSGDEVIYEKCDIFAPATLESVITEVFNFRDLVYSKMLED